MLLILTGRNSTPKLAFILPQANTIICRKIFFLFEQATARYDEVSRKGNFPKYNKENFPKII